MGRVKAAGEAAAAAAPAAPAGPASEIKVVDPQASFAGMYGDSSFTDCKVIVAGKEYLLHRVVLASRSKYLADKLERTDTLELDAPFPEVFPKVVEFMYRGELKVEPAFIMELGLTAIFLEMDSLSRLMAENLSGIIQPDSALQVLETAAKFAHGPSSEGPVQYVTQAVCDVMAPRFSEDYAEMMKLPVHVFSKIVGSRKLVIKSEDWLFDRVCEYIQTHPELDREGIRAVLRGVGFSRMNFAQTDLVNHPLLKQYAPDLISEAALVRLQAYDSHSLSRLNPLHVLEMSPFSFDLKHKAFNIKVKANGKAYKSQDNHGAIRGACPLPPTGQHYFEVHVVRMGQGKGSSLGHCYYIGLMLEEPRHKFRYSESVCDSANNNSHSWVLHDQGSATSGELKHKGSSRPHPFGFVSGDRIGVFVDMDKALMRFYRNGRRGPVAFRKLPVSKGQLYPLVAIYNSNAVASIYGKPIPQKELKAAAAAASGGKDSDSGSGSEGSGTDTESDSGSDDSRSRSGSSRSRSKSESTSEDSDAE